MSVAFAGDVEVKSVIIKSLYTSYALNIVNQVLAINIYEDMFSNFITGNISVQESLDLSSTLPMIGEEVLELNITTPGLDAPIQGLFYIYKMTDKEYLTDRSVVYSLHFVSMEAIHDTTKKISKAYAGRVDELVSRVVREGDGLGSNKNLYIDKCSNSLKYVSNFWSPIENITYLTKKALSVDNNSSFMFYENRNGFNFVSLETLYKQESFTKFRYDNSTREMTNSTSLRDVNRDYARIQYLSVPKQFDYIEEASSGAFASKLYEYNLLLKQFSSNNFRYEDNYKDREHLNKYRPRSSNHVTKFNSKVFVNTNYSELHTGYKDSTTKYNIQERVSAVGLSRNMKIEIEVPGRTDYTVGQRVEVDIPKAAPLDSLLDKVSNKELYTDLFLSGNYIVSAINHKITRAAHSCYMELIKDSTNLEVK